MRITASHIMEWANTNAKEAQVNLPRLIRRLCFDPPATRQLFFPAGDSTYVPGWDGVLFSEKSDAWVPVGKSYWEIGCNQDPTSKANGDYQKRSTQDGVEDRASATFIFVTPRRWTGKTSWIAEQCAKGDWADVRGYDADDLEQWLEYSPAVALQFAEELGLIGEGVQSLSRYWQLWSQQCNPVITSDALFIDRIEIRDNLMGKIQKGLAQQNAMPPLTIRADSVEEAVAFAVATLKHAGGLADQALVVTMSDGWRFVEANQQLKVVIAARTEVAATPTLRAGLLVIIPHAAGDVAGKPQGEEVTLERPNIYEFEKALIAIGMEESDAKRYALSTGRSWTVLRRQCATNPSIRRPAWLDVPQSESLSLLCLLGAWNASKEADRQMVERLAAKPYEEIERNLRQLVQLDDAPLLGIGTVWKVKSPLELLSLFGDRITRSELDRFFSIAREMLTTTDPQLELPDEQRYAAAIYGKVHPYSGLLFDSVCDALMKLAVRGPEQPGLRALEIEARVGQLVRELLDNASAERWLSLASYLPTLAEAAPVVFLNAVEKSLRLPDAHVTKLLTESSTSGISGRCWHSGLLWALETLAWAPNLLARVALLFAQLSHVPVKGNWGNKPSDSLFGLFRSWLPQTAAGLPERIKVLDLLIQKDSEAAFCILEGLTAPGHQTATPASRPKWREDDAGAGHGVTYAEMNEMCDVAKERLFHLSVGNPSRIAGLWQNIVRTEREEIGPVLALMEPFTLLMGNDQDREVLRVALRERIHWHRNYDETHATELEEWLLPIEALYERLAPVDLVRRHCWLFNNYWVELPIRDGDDPVQARTAALIEIRQSLGMAGIESLISACAEPGTVGTTLVGMDGVDWPEWIVEKGADFTPDVHMTWCISGLLRAIPVPRVTDLLQKVMKLGDEQGWAVTKRVRLLVLARPEQEVWKLAAACGAEVDSAYWAVVRPNIRHDKEDVELVFVLRRLLDAKRPRTALQCCQYSLKSVDPKLLYSALQQFMAGEEPEGPKLESWHLGEMLERLEKFCQIEKMELIRLEFHLFPALRYGQEAKASALYAGLMEEPALFTELVCFLYKPEHGEREEPITDGTKAAAQRAWEILRACKRQPGTQADASIDHEAFIQFIDAARELCRQKDRLIMCDQTLGQILAHAPPDEDKDKTWPFLPAREVLDRSEMEEMRTGFSIGAHNKRGVTSRSPWAGGEQERDLSVYYRSQGERVQYSHPNVAAMLEEIAKSYERDGKRGDVEANLRKEGF
ncbi:hypothetical protein BH10PSE16_BH10PSE16_02860 [soil metagenome]